jgi:hypothetical protein
MVRSDEDVRRLAGKWWTLKKRRVPKRRCDQVPRPHDDAEGLCLVCGWVTDDELFDQIADVMTAMPRSQPEDEKRLGWVDPPAGSDPVAEIKKWAAANPASTERPTAPPVEWADRDVEMLAARIRQKDAVARAYVEHSPGCDGVGCFMGRDEAAGGYWNKCKAYEQLPIEAFMPGGPGYRFGDDAHKDARAELACGPRPGISDAELVDALVAGTTTPRQKARAT